MENCFDSFEDGDDIFEFSNQSIFEADSASKLAFKVKIKDKYKEIFKRVKEADALVRGYNVFGGSNLNSLIYDININEGKILNNYMLFDKENRKKAKKVLNEYTTKLSNKYGSFTSTPYNSKDRELYMGTMAYLLLGVFTEIEFKSIYTDAYDNVFLEFITGENLQDRMSKDTDSSLFKDIETMIGTFAVPESAECFINNHEGLSRLIKKYMPKSSCGNNIGILEFSVNEVDITESIKKELENCNKTFQLNLVDLDCRYKLSLDVEVKHDIAEAIKVIGENLRILVNEGYADELQTVPIYFNSLSTDYNNLNKAIRANMFDLNCIISNSAVYFTDVYDKLDTRISNILQASVMDPSLILNVQSLLRAITDITSNEVEDINGRIHWRLEADLLNCNYTEVAETIQQLEKMDTVESVSYSFK